MVCFNRRFLFIISLASFLYSCQDKDTNTSKPATPPLIACADSVIAGYIDKVSYFPGDEMEVFLQSNSKLECGLGFYTIKGSMAFSGNVSLFPQTILSDQPWKNGFNFIGNGKIRLPITLSSGVYLIENRIPFIVKSTAATDVTVVYPSNTINAYNPSGGKSLYGFNSTESVASHLVSFLRPMESAKEKGECFECFKWFPSLANIKIKYISDLDLDEYTSIQSKVLIVAGHSEYWTRSARANFDRFVNEGGHAIILSGNTMWWQVRYTNARDGLICYRDALLDPETDITKKTILWTDPTLSYPIIPSIGEDFDYGGYGLKTDNGWNGYKIFNPSSPLLEGLAFNKGDILNLPSQECDGAPIKSWDADGFPILDNDKFHFAKLELIGFDRGTRGGLETIPTFSVMQKTNSSGVIVNVGSIGWCSSEGMGSQNSGDKIKTITQNAIYKLVAGASVFSN